eukprot:3459259-Pleurochrysis_carterae.AAC.2
MKSPRFQVRWPEQQDRVEGVPHENRLCVLMWTSGVPIHHSCPSLKGTRGAQRLACSLLRQSSLKVHGCSFEPLFRLPRDAHTTTALLQHACCRGYDTLTSLGSAVQCQSRVPCVVREM